jgi:hypothetical protein
MPVRIAHVDRVICGVGVAVEVDAGEDGVPGVGGEEAAGEGVVISRVEVLQAVRRANDSLDRLLVRLTSVEALVDVGLSVEHGGAVGGERVSEGAVVMARGGLPSGHEEDEAITREMVLDAPRSDKSFTLRKSIAQGNHCPGSGLSPDSGQHPARLPAQSFGIKTELGCR